MQERNSFEASSWSLNNIRAARAACMRTAVYCRGLARERTYVAKVPTSSQLSRGAEVRRKDTLPRALIEP
jgi:hypothetical protein